MPTRIVALTPAITTLVLACFPISSRYVGFYEKVVKVKADVAAIFKFFPHGRSRLAIWTRPRWRQSGGCARGVSAERFETPLAGGAAAPMRASAFCWRAACQRLGGNPPAPAFPRRGKRERGRSDFLAAAGIRARSTTTFLSIVITNLYAQSARSASQKSCWPRHPLLCRASIRTLHGPCWARCILGSDLKPRSITTVTDLGCWVLPSFRRSLKDQPT